MTTDPTGSAVPLTMSADLERYARAMGRAEWPPHGKGELANALTGVLAELDATRAKLAEAERERLEARMSFGIWRCSCCGEMRKPFDSHWRMAGDHWQHKCATTHPQHGHERAEFFGFPKFDEWAAAEDARSAAESEVEAAAELVARYREALAVEVESMRDGYTVDVVSGVLLKDKDGSWLLVQDVANRIRAALAAPPTQETGGQS